MTVARKRPSYRLLSSTQVNVKVKNASSNRNVYYGDVTTTTPSVREVVADEMSPGSAGVAGKKLESWLLMDSDGSWTELRVTGEVFEYLRIEASRRNISMIEMYKIEKRAEQEILALGVTEQFLADAIASSNPPQRRLATDQDCPFRS